MENNSSSKKVLEYSDHCGTNQGDATQVSTSKDLSSSVKNYPDSQAQVPSDCGNNVEPTVSM